VASWLAVLPINLKDTTEKCHFRKPLAARKGFTLSKSHSLLFSGAADFLAILDDSRAE